MKNIQVIDGAENCTYDLFAIDDADFDLIFPEGRDIEFIDDFIDRVGEEKAGKIMEKVWKNWMDKKNAHGIHGTIFYELEYKKKYYPNKNERDIFVNYRKDD